MLAVSNTSPISNLAIIGRLDFLRLRYEVLRIPLAVASELSNLSHPGGKQYIDAAFRNRWLIVEKVDTPLGIQFPYSLDPGESEAIALACKLKANVLLMDEKRGREVARKYGLVVAGVLGELIHAKQVGWLPNIYSEIEKLRQEARFFVDTEIERYILSQVGE